MVMLGERMSARQALEWGVAIMTTPVDELERTAGHMATRLAGTSAQALQSAKRLLDAALDDDIDAGLTQESIAQSSCARTATIRPHP
jgi:2-(1,2-epoxy-1,2-dihydrophenyl)acetyl-CoA isomerase